MPHKRSKKAGERSEKAGERSEKAGKRPEKADEKQCNKPGCGCNGHSSKKPEVIIPEGYFEGSTNNSGGVSHENDGNIDCTEEEELETAEITTDSPGMSLQVRAVTTTTTSDKAPEGEGPSVAVYGGHSQHEEQKKAQKTAVLVRGYRSPFPLDEAVNSAKNTIAVTSSSDKASKGEESSVAVYGSHSHSKEPDKSKHEDEHACCPHDTHDESGRKRKHACCPHDPHDERPKKAQKTAASGGMCCSTLSLDEAANSANSAIDSDNKDNRHGQDDGGASPQEIEPEAGEVTGADDTIKAYRPGQDDGGASPQEIAPEAGEVTGADDMIKAYRPGQDGGGASPEEIAPEAGEAAGGHESLVHVPHNASEIGLTASIGYLSAGGAVIGAKVFHEFGKKAQELERAYGSLEHNNSGLPEENRRVYMRYLERQKRDARFQQWGAGAASGAGSALVCGGLFFSPLSTAGLGTLAGTGVAHMAHSCVQYSENSEAICRAQGSKGEDKHVREHIFRSRGKHLARNIAGWGLFGLGAGCLAAIDAAKYVASFIMPPAGVIAGVGTMVGGVALTTVHNNILNGSRFGAALHSGVKETLANPLSREDVAARNVLAYEQRNIAKAYRSAYFKERGVCAKAFHGFARAVQKVSSIATLGLIPALTHGFKHRMKNAVAVQFTPESEKADKERLHALTALTEQRGKPEGEAGTHESINADLVENSGLAGDVSRVLTDTAFEKKGGGKNAVLTLKKKYRQAFSEEECTQLESVAAGNAGSCCAAHSASDVAKKFLELTVNKNNQDEQGKENRAVIAVRRLINGAIDHALIFGLRKNAKTDMFVYSSLSDEYERYQKEESPLKGAAGNSKYAQKVLPRSSYQAPVSHTHAHTHGHSCGHGCAH